MRNLHRLTLVLLIALLVGGCTPGSDAEQVASTTATPAPTQAEDSPTIQPTDPPTVPLPTETEPPATEPPAAMPANPTPAPTGTMPTASSAAGTVSDLQDLTLDDFFEESYRQLLLRNPEKLTGLGMARSYGLRNDQLNDLSESYIRETQELETAILEVLRTYDRSQLTPEQQISYDVYEWYLDDLVRGHEFTYHNYPVHHFIGSYQDELVRLFTELHPLTGKDDAEDYLSRVAQVDDQVDQLLAGLEKREDLGVIPPRFIVDMTVRDLRSLARSAGAAQ